MNRKFFKIMILKISFLIIIILNECYSQTDNIIEEKDDEKIWEMLIKDGRNPNETIPSSEVVTNEPEVQSLSEINDDVDDNFSSVESKQDFLNDDSKQIDEFSTNKRNDSDFLININDPNNSNLNKTYTKLLENLFENHKNFIPNENSNDNKDFPITIPSNSFPETIEALDEFAFPRYLRGKHNSNDLYLKNKYGSRIIEDPSYNEPLTKRPEPGQRSLVIIFDGTGSMVDDLKQLTEGAEAIITEITQRKKNPIYNYIFVPFRDPYVGPKLVTQDLNRLLTELRNLPLFGGGDCPESAIGGINLALESALPKSFIFVFTDATATDFRLNQTTIDLIQKHQATLTFLLTGFCNSKDSEGYYVYEKLAALSNGQIFNLKKTDIREVLESVRTSLDEDAIPIDYVYSKDPGTHSIDIPVDHSLRELTVSVAGQNPNVTLTDPNEVKRTDVNELLNLSNLKVINVQDPIPGKWNVETGADSGHSVKLTALSNLKFDFGFSSQNPRTINETNLNPTKSILNILSIAPSDNNLVEKLTFVKLVPSDSNDRETESNIQLPLTYLSPNGDLNNSSIYVTEPFYPPLEMFKIYVEGFDPKGNSLRHLISTAIQVENGEKPKIWTQNNYVEFLEGSNGTISCEYQTLIPANISWINNKNKIFKVDESSKKSIGTKFENIQLDDAGTYTCMIENEFGTDEQIITVIVKENIIPLTVKLMQPYMISRENDVDYQISCYASPSENVNYTWFFEGTEIRNGANFEISSGNLIIKHIDRRNKGYYTCRANNRRTSGNDTAYMDVLFESGILHPEDEWHTANLGDNINLDCETEGNPAPLIQWTLPSSSSPSLDRRFENVSIINFSVETGGLYSCKVSNGIGNEKSKNFYIDVREKPIIHNIIPSNEDDKVLDIITGDEDTYKIYEGYTGTFICNATGNPEPLYNWVKVDSNGEEFIFSDDEIFLINDVTEWDSGKYVCIAENVLGKDMKSIKLYVVVPPRMKSTEDVVIMVEKGQYVNLNCDAFGNPFPAISWSLNNNSLDENDAYYTFENTSLVFPANLKDSGIYECFAQNDGGHATKKIVLLVYVPPSIYPPNDEVMNAILHQNTTISCVAEGYPKPNITWSKNGVPLVNGREFHIKDNGELVVLNSTISNEGMYTCQAQNQHGVAQKNYYLNVIYVPKIVSDLPKTVKLLPSESVSLNCSADGNPSADIIWIKDHTTVLAEKTSSVLTLSNSAQQSISGFYTCLAQNSLGSDQKYVEVIGIEMPIVDNNKKPSDNTINATLNENVQIYCHILNAQEYRWYKNGEELFGEDRNVLQLNSISWNEHGNYTCIGKNDAGSAELTQQLVVWTTPQFTDNSNESDYDDEVENKPKPKNIELKLGENITLRCSPQGYPEPKIEWRKDKTLLSHSSELHLTNIQIAHSGEYICRATNIFGESEKIYNINVQVPPTLQMPKNNWVELSPGEDLKLECNLIGNPQPLIYWKKNGANISEFQEILQIENPQINDSGEYKCIGMNLLGNEEITFDVDVLAPPKFISSKNDIKIHEKDNIELECIVLANPLPIVAWSFNNKVLWSTSSLPSIEGEEIIYTDQSGNPLLYLYPNETISNEIPRSGQYGKLIRKDHTLKALLVIEDQKRKKSGLYKCHSINSLGSQEQAFNVQINYPPVLKGSENDRRTIVNVTVLEDLPLILYCPWQGNPPPKITWTKDNQPIYQYSDTTLSKDMKTLTIFHANLNHHSGEFICTAVNEMGTNKKNFFVKILVPPKFEKDNDNLEDIIPYTHVIGQKTILECPVTGNPPPTIFWLQQNENEKRNNDFEILPTNSSQLILDDIRSSGIYSCYANNSLGFIEKKYSVEVQRIPFINSDDSPKEQIFKEYQTITLHCPAEGTPKPTINWYKDGRIVEDMIPNVQFSYDKSIIKIPNARKEHSGTYTCFATNKLGESRKDTRILVKTPVIWTEWESWTPCSKSCGTGTKSRRRRCIQLNGELANDESECKGANYESELCEMLPCPVDGRWSEWTQWTSCSKSCTDVNDTFRPTRKRYRECNSPKPMYGGRHCIGLDYEEELCNTDYCPIDGGWSDWTQWSSCSVTCGAGKKERYRKCNNPVPAYGGKLCKGRSSDVAYCYPQPCPINGGWSEWSAWSECSQTCGTGLKKRSRTCTNPTPKYGGSDCVGENMEIAKCRKQKCPNSSLLRSLQPLKNQYGPAAEYDSATFHFQDTSEEDDQMMLPQEPPQYQYALGSMLHSNTPPSSNEQKSEFINPAGRKVVVTLKNYKPIHKDTKEISLHPGLAPFRIERILPCPFGYELDENNQCKDVDECQIIESVCEENETCRNIDGGFVCSCRIGFHFDNKEGKCVDTDECANENLNDCSHTCHNTIGSYTCSCPDTYMLNPDKKGCGPDPLYSGDGYMADFAPTNFPESQVKNLNSIECFDGYQLLNGICEDINECTDMEHDCDYEQQCLNTKGSYLCIPTPCPEDYEKDDQTGICVRMCDKAIKCKEAKIAELLTYILLPLDKINISDPFYTLLSYDLNRNVLIDTEFILEKGKHSKLFKLETIEVKRGIAYLYVMKKLRKEKLYSIRVIAKSYDPNSFELIYITKFVIYLYLL